ncbi:MAG: hypothetical protein WCK13_01060 [Ignavibacteriota bacterium]|nr:hypothetical protein [Ignavibacteriota bacterium]
MKTKKIFLILVSVLFVSNFSFAQDEFNVGSLYSAFGIGDMRYSASIRTDMMGIQGIGLYGNYINTLNPASNTYLRSTLVSLGLRGVLLNTSNSAVSAKYSDFNVTGFNLGVPVWQDKGLVIQFGFNPYSVMQYKIIGNVTQNGTTFSETFAGLGGLTRLNFGVSGRPLRFISLGAEYNYAFGNIKNLTYFNFNSPFIYNTFIKSENGLRGNYFKGGAVLEFGSLFPRSKLFENFNVGFYYQNKFSMSSKVDEIHLTSLGYLDTTRTSSSDVSVPESYGFGFSKQIGRQLIVSSDIMFQKYGGFTSKSLLPANYQDNFRYGIGLEILPKIGSDKSFFEGITYRMGFSYDNSTFKINDEYVNNYAANFGFGIPINSENAVDLGVTVGTRGSTGNGLVKDNYLKFNVGFNFGEFWFLRPREDER